MASDEDELRLRLRQDYDAPGLLEVQDVVVKAGPQAWKTAALLTFGDKTSGVVSRRTLRVQTWRRSTGGGYGFEQKSDYRWSCDDEEISRVSALLTTNLPAVGTYTLVDESSSAAIIARLAEGDAAAAAGAVAELLTLPAVRDALAASGAAVAGAALVSAQRQRAALERLRVATLDPETTEHELHKTLSGEWWLFGGRFLGEHSRRKFTSLDQLDIPLLRADGSLHVVELKRANIPKLVVPYRNHLVAGEDVHLAAGQAMNYLRALDEQAAQIRQDFALDVRRATATVVIGHPDYCFYSEEEVAQTLRTYNSHLARVEVITYAELLMGASAALATAEAETGTALSDGRVIGAADKGTIEPDPTSGPWSIGDGWTTGGSSWSATAASWGDEPPF